MYVVGTKIISYSKFLVRKQVTEFLIFPLIPFSLPGFLMWGRGVEKSKRKIEKLKQRMIKTLT